MYLIKETPLLRPWQGDIYNDVNLIQDITYTLTIEGEKEYIVNEIRYNYAVVMSQECDLEQDYKNRIENKEDHDKYIPMILMAPAYLAESLRNGDHLQGYGQKMQRINSREWEKLKKNDNKRYHYLKADINMNVPELVIDFKHFFTIYRDYFYSEIMNGAYLASLTILHREELSQRFCNFLSRIGIPDNIKETKLLTNSLCLSKSSKQV